jgi:hypothetical protein
MVQFFFYDLGVWLSTEGIWKKSDHIDESMTCLDVFLHRYPNEELHDTLKSSKYPKYINLIICLMKLDE